MHAKISMINILTIKSCSIVHFLNLGSGDMFVPERNLVIARKGVVKSGEVRRAAGRGKPLSFDCRRQLSIVIQWQNITGWNRDGNVGPHPFYHVAIQHGEPGAARSETLATYGQSLYSASVAAPDVIYQSVFYVKGAEFDDSYLTGNRPISDWSQIEPERHSDSLWAGCSC